MTRIWSIWRGQYVFVKTALSLQLHQVWSYQNHLAHHVFSPMPSGKKTPQTSWKPSCWNRQATAWSSHLVFSCDFGKVWVLNRHGSHLMIILGRNIYTHWLITKHPQNHSIHIKYYIKLPNFPFLRQGPISASEACIQMLLEFHSSKTPWNKLELIEANVYPLRN